MNKEIANIEPWKKKANNRLCSVEVSGRSPAPCSQKEKVSSR